MHENKSILIYESNSADNFYDFGNPLITFLLEKYPEIPQMSMDVNSDHQLQNVSEQFISCSKNLLFIIHFGLNTEVRGLSRLLLAAKELQEVTLLINQRETMAEKIFSPQKIHFVTEWVEIIKLVEAWIRE